MTKTFKVIIAGSRYYSDYEKLRSTCDWLLSKKLANPEYQVIVLSGGAPGADSLGERYARERGLAIERHPADWDAHGRAAGPIRNEEMAAMADALIAFPLEGAANRGTQNMVRLAREHGLQVRIAREHTFLFLSLLLSIVHSL